MEPARDLVGVVVELPAGMEGGHDDLGSRLSLFGVDVHRDPAAVVHHGHRVVRVQDDLYLRAVARERLVHAVIHHFEHHVVEPGAIVRIPDVHAGALAHSVKAFQDLDLRGIVGVVGCHQGPPKKSRYSSIFVNPPRSTWNTASSFPRVSPRRWVEVRKAWTPISRRSVSTRPCPVVSSSAPKSSRSRTGRSFCRPARTTASARSRITTNCLLSRRDRTAPAWAPPFWKATSARGCPSEDWPRAMSAPRVRASAASRGSSGSHPGTRESSGIDTPISAARRWAAGPTSARKASRAEWSASPWVCIADSQGANRAAGAPSRR